MEELLEKPSVFVGLATFFKLKSPNPDALVGKSYAIEVLEVLESKAVSEYFVLCLVQSQSSIVT